MKHETACRRRRVDVFSQRPEPGTAFPDRLYDVQKVLQGPRQAVILRDSYNIAVAELLQHLVQLWPRAPRSADLVCENPLGSSC